MIAIYRTQTSMKVLEGSAFLLVSLYLICLTDLSIDTCQSIYHS